MNSDNEPWYSVKMVFYEPGYHFEERIVVIQATDFHNAQEKGIHEATEYIASLTGLQFIAIVDIFHTFEAHLEDKAEVYSKITKSELSAGMYLRARYEDYDGEVVYRHANTEN